MLESLGNPQGQFGVVHIGGTNGKGSVAALVAQALLAAGVEVGLYTSPHLVEVTERIVVSGTPISQDAFATWTVQLQAVIEETGASFFEASTAIALAHFAALRVEIAVVEVGLGGRLDSTNVLNPLVSAVTNVGRDHQEYLGSELVDIAREKAAIAKTSVPFIIGETVPDLRAVLLGLAQENGAEPILVPPEARYEGQLRLSGPHQRRNAAVAQQILECLPAPFRPDPAAVVEAFGAARLPGRFERRGRWILDVAHNENGMLALVDAVTELSPARPIHVLFGVLVDKPLSAMLEHLLGVVDWVWVTLPPSAPANRALKGKPDALPGRTTYEPDFDRALHDFQIDAQTLLVTGSFHTVGDAMARLPGFQPFG